MKINKACDLSSISVLPPQSRSAAVCNEPESSSIFGKSQTASQFRSQQQSQQSFSLGLSSQHGVFSQLSQNSHDEALTNDLRFGSQERENSAKRTSCIAPANFAREENQMMVSRSSTNMMRRWNPAVADQKSDQVSDELEHKMGTIETSLSRFGMMLDAVQCDIMQVNKVTKEISMTMESIRQKFIVQEDSIRGLIKGQEDIKVSIEGKLKSISETLNQSVHEGKLQEISLMLSAVLDKIESSMSKFQYDLQKSCANEIQGCVQKMVSNLKAVNEKCPSPVAHQRKAINKCVHPWEMLPIKNTVIQSSHPAIRVPKVEMGARNSVKHEQPTLPNTYSRKGQRPKELPCMKPEREWRVVIDSDEDIDGGFSCLLEERETGTGNYSVEEAKEETERILRKARRKRKHFNAITII